jgi:hypothetical protein
MDTPEKETLSRCISSIDGHAQDGLGRIEALATLALLAMQAPAAHRSLEPFARVLEVIAGISEMTRDEITLEVEKAGADFYVDSAQDARQVATRQWREMSAIAGWA